MRKLAVVRIFVIGLLTILAAGGISLLGLLWLTNSISNRHRIEFVQFLGESIEAALVGVSISDISTPEGTNAIKQKLRFVGPACPPRGGLPPNMRGGVPPGFGRAPTPPSLPFAFLGPGPRRSPKRGFALVSESGKILFKDGDEINIGGWKKYKKPSEMHQIEIVGSFLNSSEEKIIYKLNFEPSVYLVIGASDRLFFGPLVFVQILLTIGTLVISLVLGFVITFFYLKSKSQEAHNILYRLESGDLRARFTIRDFDEFGGLMLDFNRMADSIEHLVERVRVTENTRRELLQELGHDLRTPLTSLTTSYETIKAHLSDLSSSEREDLLTMMGAEIEYLTELLDNLMTISAIEEPQYKRTSETVDMLELVRREISNRESIRGSKIEWTMAIGDNLKLPHVVGNYNLMQRMIRNGLDNAVRYARSKIHVTLASQGGMAVLRIRDDGPGFSDEALKMFGKRRGTRAKRDEQGLHFSIGLGSVIMKSIADIHQGSIMAENDLESGGAVVTIRLPLPG